MSRTSLLRFTLALASVAVVSGLGIAPAAIADTDPTAVPVDQVATMSYGDATTVVWTRPNNALPAGVTYVGIPQCPRLADGSAITSALSPGYHDLDPTSCTGLTLGGPNSAGLHVVYASSRIYVAAADVNVVVTAPSPAAALLSTKAKFTAKVTSRRTHVPATGVTVHFGTGGRFFQYLCSAVTNASGVATCTGSGAKYFSLIKASPEHLMSADSDLTPYWYWGNGWVKAPSI